MKTFAPLLSTLVLAFSVGCSGSAFDVAESPDADDETSVDDSSSSDTGSSSDSSVDDGSSPDADSGSEDTNADTCTKNACGGCTILDHDPGTTCGTCSKGKWTCNGGDKVDCVGDEKNACGGCGTLENAPGVACGTCSTLKYKCSDDKTQTVCPGDDKNECGGCGTIANPVGKSCGTCNTKSYVCTSDKNSTVCSGDDANACGGCGTIASDKLPGSTCGFCATLKYVCLSDKTATACPSGGEDRTTGVDALYTTNSDQIYTVPTIGYPIAIGFNTQRFGSITSLTLSLLRTETGSGSTFLGSFQAVLVRGSSPDSTDELASFTIAQEAISTIGVAPVTIPLPTPTANVAAGTRLFLKLRETSDKYNFSVFGGSPGGPTDFGLFYRTSSGTWSKLTSASPYLTVGVNGCF